MDRARPPAAPFAPSGDLYDPAWVRRLFDDMAATYGVTNYVSSFGFTERWRRACVARAGVRPGMTVYDWMSGMGECWGFLGRALGGEGRLVGLDLSPVMCAQAAARYPSTDRLAVEVVCADVLANDLPDASADVVVSAFGLKTFSPAQQARLAREVARVLRPGGRFSFLEISVPPARMLRVPYLAYLHRAIPPLGRLFLGNPEAYRMLGRYTEAFGSSAAFAGFLRRAGLRGTLRPYFFGCATGVDGYRPA